MKKYFYIVLTFFIFLFISLDSISANITNLNFKYVNPSASQVKNKTVLISPGVSFELGKYLNNTSFKKQRDFSPLFTTKFTKKFLKRPVKYEEVVEGLGDRMKVVRKIIIDYKNPCDSKIPSNQSYCFKPTAKKMTKAIKKDIALMRTKLQEKIRKSKRPNEQKELKKILSLNDKMLLGYVLNQSSTQKTVTQTSFLPLVSLAPNSVGNINLSKLNKGLPKQPSNIKITRNLNLSKNITNKLKSIPKIQSQSTNTNKPVYRFNNKNNHRQNIVMGKIFGKSYNNQFEVTFAKERSWHNRYYLGFYFNFGFKFGFQFPFTLKVNTEITHVHQMQGRKMLAQYPANSLCPEATQASEAYLCAALGKATISATAASTSASNNHFYTAAGVPRNQLENQEFIFKIDASCYMTISVPGSKKNYGCPKSIKINEGEHFQPPLGSSNNQRLFGFYLPDDIARSVPLGLDIGIAYAILMPGVSVHGEDGSLTFDVVPDKSKFAPKINQITLGTNSQSIGVQEKLMRSPGADWGLKIKNPQYSFKASLLPSFKAQLGIDYVYDWHKTFGPFDLDSVKINLGEYNFSRLSSTPREHSFKMGTRKEN